MHYDFPMIIPVAFDRLRGIVEIVYDALLTKLLCWLWGVRYGSGTRFSGKAIIRSRSKREIIIGSKVRFVSRKRVNVTGLTNPTILDTRWGGRIIIGDRSGFSSVVISSKTKIEIGARCLFGGNVRLFDHDFHAVEAEYRGTSNDCLHTHSKAIHIGDDCFIGANVLILKGTKIGDRSIVAAGSVVFGLDIPPDSLVRGNPAVCEKRSMNAV